jgi:hypothetical protein
MTTESTFLELVLDYGSACERAANAPKQKKADAIADRHDAFEAVKHAFRAVRTGDR